MFHLEVVESSALRKDLFQKGPQGRNIPLAVAQIVDQVPRRFFRPDLEPLVERVVSRLHPQVGIQHDHGFPHGVHDALGEAIGL